MKKKSKHDISDSDTSSEKDVSSNKKNSPKKNREQGNISTNSTLNGSEVLSKLDQDSEDDAILRDIGTSTTEAQKSFISRNNTETSDKAAKGHSIGTFCVKDLSPDDEVYTFYCPDFNNKQEFCNKAIESLGSVLDKKHGNIHVEFLQSEKKFITVALPTNRKSGCLMNLPYKGHIIIQKSLEIPNENFNMAESEYKVQLPDNLKVRHPLLGVEWESHLSLAEKAISNSHLFHKKNKKSKKEKRKRNSEADSSRHEESSDILSPPVKKKKKS